MNLRHERKYYRQLRQSEIRWQKVASLFTLCLVLGAVASIIISTYYNNKLIRESIESRIAENRPLIDIRKYPMLPRKDAAMNLEIKNVGKGCAYNILYSYHYYDYFSKELLYEFGGPHWGDQSFTVLQPGDILNYFTEEDKGRFNISDPDGLPFIFAFDKGTEIIQKLDSTFVACAVYVEYEDYKGNVFWTARQFGLRNQNLNIPILAMVYPENRGRAVGSFMQRARSRAVKSRDEFFGLKVFERSDLIQTEKSQDTLWQRILK